MATPQRFNGFNLIHKAFRLMLMETTDAIQQNDFTDTGGTAPLLAEVEKALMYLEDHAHHEDSLIFPHLAKHEPELIARFEAEHGQDNQLSHRVKGAVAAWRVAATDDARYTAGRNLLYAFGNFTAFNICHMNREEVELCPLFWKHYTDEELLDFNIEVSRIVEPAKALEQNKWVMKAINIPEALTMLGRAQKVAPPEVFANLIKIAETNMEPAKWEAVKKGLFKTA